MHEHVRPVAIAEFLPSGDLARLVVLGVGVGVGVGGVSVGDTPPAAGLVHVGAVLGDGERRKREREREKQLSKVNVGGGGWVVV